MASLQPLEDFNDLYFMLFDEHAWMYDLIMMLTQCRM